MGETILFHKKKLDEIGDSYYHGYIAGCMSVKPNTLAGVRRCYRPHQRLKRLGYALNSKNEGKLQTLI